MILILANGESTRMPNKHLLMRLGRRCGVREPIIWTTVVEAMRMTDEPIKILTHNPLIGDLFEPLQHRVDIVWMPHTRCTSETLLESVPLWIGHPCIKVALGDVIWDEQSFRYFVLRFDPSAIKWFNDTQDIFGIHIPAPFAVAVRVAAKELLHEEPLHNEGRLWALRDHLNLRCKNIDQHIGDETMDVDCMEDYAIYLYGDTKNKLKGTWKKFHDPADTEKLIESIKPEWWDKTKAYYDQNGSHQSAG